MKVNTQNTKIETITEKYQYMESMSKVKCTIPELSTVAVKTFKFSNAETGFAVLEE